MTYERDLRMQLLAMIDECLQENPQADQAVAVKTAAGNMYCFANNIDSHTVEDHFVNMLVQKGEAAITHVGCKFGNRYRDKHSTGISPISRSFLEKIVLLDERNRYARHFLSESTWPLDDFLPSDFPLP